MELLVILGAVGLWLVFDGVTRPRSSRVSGGKLASLLSEAGSSMPPSRFIALSAVLGGTTGLVVAGFTGSRILAAAAAGIAAWVPTGRMNTRRAVRRTHHREAWPDCISALVAIVRSGGSIASACVDLPDRAPEALRPAWSAFRSQYRASGRFAQALSAMSSTAADPIADRVAVVLRTVHEVGGSELVPVLRALAESIRSDLRLIREVEARWSWTVTAARVAAAAPWVVLVLMATRPEAAAAYTSPGGVFVVLGGAAATAVGYRAMLRAARLPTEARLQR